MRQRNLDHKPLIDTCCNQWQSVSIVLVVRSIFYGMPGLALLMNVLRAARLSSKLLGQGYICMSGNVWNRPSGSFMVDMGVSSNIMKSPSPKCYMTFLDMVIYSDTLNWSNITPIFEPITELDLITNFELITKFREVSIEHCNWCGLPTDDAYSSGHLLLSHLGLAFILMLRPFCRKLVMSTDLLSFQHLSVRLFCF